MPNRVAGSLGLVAAAAAVLMSCAAGSKVLPPAGNTAYGVYHFREVLATAHPAVTLEGDVALLPDTITISLKDSPCVYTPANHGNIRTIAYQCGDFGFSFNRQNPLRENSYSVPTVQYDNQRICLQTGIVNGRETCTKYGSERVEKRMTVFGKLSFVGK